MVGLFVEPGRGALSIKPFHRTCGRLLWSVNDEVSVKSCGLTMWSKSVCKKLDSTVFKESLLASGDRRKIVDCYRDWTYEAIVVDLYSKRHDFHVAVKHWVHDFNIGVAIRPENYFNVVHIFDKCRWERRGDGHRLLLARVPYIRMPGNWSNESTREVGADGSIALIEIDNLPGGTPSQKRTHFCGTTC